VFSYSSSFISMGFAGHIGRHELSAAVLGTSILNVTGFAVMAGLASAMETLCGQVGGRKAIAAHQWNQWGAAGPIWHSE
jgi:multidrug resistance protein, MATE family